MTKIYFALITNKMTLTASLIGENDLDGILAQEGVDRHDRRDQPFSVEAEESSAEDQEVGGRPSLLPYRSPSDRGQRAGGT